MELPKKFTYPFSYTPHPLVIGAAERLISYVSSHPALDDLFSEGKMLGVLLVSGHGVVPATHGHPWPCKWEGPSSAGRDERSEGCSVQLPCPETESDKQCIGETAENIGVLWGFSGLAGGRSMVEGFVPPIFDLTDPDGYFKKREAEISELTPLIAGESDPSRKAELIERRKSMSEELQKWIFEQFVVLNAKGESRNVYDVFAERGAVPPGGTGDCALPKMLQYAYKNGLKPIAFGEFWYGRSPKSEVRRHGSFYPSCMGKCGPLLAYMLRGVDVEPNPMEAYGGVLLHEPEILYEDDAIIVVDKPSGLLSVPGKIKAESVLAFLQRRANRLGNGERIFSCHRLDMDTSGVLVFAKSVELQAAIMRQFEDRKVSKSYLALLSAGGKQLRQGDSGTIELPLMLDYYDRPRQMVDDEGGKAALTEYEVLEVGDDGEAMVRFVPHTGRTHQLRVHSAHAEGLGRPIKGDRLYGDMTSGGRLCLHAESLSFDHPVSGERMSFRTVPDFL